MGIPGLLPFLKNSTKCINISEFSGQTIAIDAMCWIHKGCYSQVEAIYNHEKTDCFVKYCFKLIDKLRAHNIKPIMVFDGRNLPAKSFTEIKRKKAREGNRKKAENALMNGMDRESARKFMVAALDVTSEMIGQVIAECRNQKVDFLVSPYESDTQCAYLELAGMVDAVLTEDSDLVVFGARQVLFKLDCGSGQADMYSRDKLGLSLNANNSNLHMTFHKFRVMCILAGCDYLEGLPGVGLQTAFKLVSRCRQNDLHDFLTRLPALITAIGGSKLRTKVDSRLGQSYVNSFKKAYFTFKHQTVFCPHTLQARPLTEYEEDIENIDPELLQFAGPFDPSNSAEFLHQARGNLNTRTLRIIDQSDDLHTLPIDTIWRALLDDDDSPPPAKIRKSVCLKESPFSSESSPSIATDSTRLTTPIATDSTRLTTSIATESTRLTMSLATDSLTTPIATDTRHLTTSLATESTRLTTILATDSARLTTPIATGSTRLTTPIATVPACRQVSVTRRNLRETLSSNTGASVVSRYFDCVTHTPSPPPLSRPTPTLNKFTCPDAKVKPKFNLL